MKMFVVTAVDYEKNSYYSQQFTAETQDFCKTQGNNLFKRELLYISF